METLSPGVEPKRVSCAAKQQLIGFALLADRSLLAQRGPRSAAAPPGRQVLGKETWARPDSTQQLRKGGGNIRGSGLTRFTGGFPLMQTSAPLL